MRFKRNEMNDRRIKTKFALFPVTAEASNAYCRKETRWLEKVTIRQTYRPDLCLFGWNNDFFIANEK